MKFQARFLKLYERLEEGWTQNAIIAYSKRPWEQKTTPRKTYFKYKHILLVNLWFIRLRFRWVDKDYAPAEV